MAFEDYLSQHDKNYDEAELPEGGGGGLPDGDHTARIVESFVEEAPWGSVQLNLKFENDQGSVRKWNALDDPERLGYVKADLKRLGYEGPLSKVEYAAPGFVGAICEIHVKRKEGQNGKVFTNVYLNNVLEQGKGETAAVSQAASDDDVPF